MLCTLIGMFLKILGIVVAMPNVWRQYKQWRDKEMGKLWEANSAYLRNGYVPKVPLWKRCIFRVTKMPNPHLWSRKYDRSRSENENPRHSKIKRVAGFPKRVFSVVSRVVVRRGKKSADSQL
jgi:hypothetical protein